MSKFLINLINDKDEIGRIFKSRSKQYLEKTVYGKTIEIAREKAEVETKEGWELLPRKFKKSVKLRKPKAADVQLEDDVWSLLVRMGFDEYSKDRNYKIVVSEKSPPRQIDVFAKDDEAVLLVECTCCDEKKEKDLSSLIDKIKGMRNEVFSSIKTALWPFCKN